MKNMNWSNPYLWFCATTGTILVVLLIVRGCRHLYWYFTGALFCFSLFLFMTKSPEEGADDFRTANTIRMILANHRVLASWKREAGYYPPAGMKGLEDLKTYDSSVFYRDAWGRDLRYEIVSGNPRFTSAGPDGKFGTADDIVR